jgi:hypothetical protein
MSNMIYVEMVYFALSWRVKFMVGGPGCEKINKAFGTPGAGVFGCRSLGLNFLGAPP